MILFQYEINYWNLLQSGDALKEGDGQFSF